MAEGDMGMENPGWGGFKPVGIFIRAQFSYYGEEEAGKLGQDMETIGNKATQTQSQIDSTSRATMRQAMQFRMLGMSVMSAVGSFAALAGASREQMAVIQALNAILMMTITLYSILDIVSGGGSMVAGGGIKGVAGFARGFGMLARVGGSLHQGGYGRDQLAVIQSNERVIPSYRIMTNYGGNITIGTMVLTGGTGKDIARDFTEQLESFKQRGVQSPEWG